jgi:hypothetical protein
MSRLVRVWADDDGESHVEELEFSAPGRGAGGPPSTIPAAGSPVLRSYPGGADAREWVGVDWHQPPGKTFAVAISGEIEVEVTDGSTMAIGQGDLVFLEDIRGRGHITRLRGGVTNLFIPVAADFDVVSWVGRRGVPV